MTNYTLTFHRASDVVVRHFTHEAGLPVLSALIAKQGFLVIPDGATDALGSPEDPMTVFSRYIISLQARGGDAPNGATASALADDPARL